MGREEEKHLKSWHGFLSLYLQREKKKRDWGNKEDANPTPEEDEDC